VLVVRQRYQAGGAPNDRDAEDAAAPDGATRALHAAQPEDFSRTGSIRPEAAYVFEGNGLPGNLRPVGSSPHKRGVGRRAKPAVARRIIR